MRQVPVYGFSSVMIPPKKTERSMVDRFQCMGKIYSKEFKTQEISIVDFDDSGRVADRESGIEIVLVGVDIVLHLLDDICDAFLIDFETIDQFIGLGVLIGLAGLGDFIGISCLGCGRRTVDTGNVSVGALFQRTVLILDI